jgi:hypothetical protein
MARPYREGATEQQEHVAAGELQSKRDQLTIL